MRTAAPPIKDTSAPGSGIGVKPRLDFASNSNPNPNAPAYGEAFASAPQVTALDRQNTTVIMADAAIIVRLIAGVYWLFKVVVYSEGKMGVCNPS
jgi:hypothetical protein